MSINPQKTRFYATILLNRILEGKASFDSGFSELVKKYKISPRESAILYRLFYKIVLYYHSLKFLVRYHGYPPRVNGVIEYLYMKGFNFDAILDEVKEIASTLSPVLKISVMYGYPEWFVRDLYGRIPHEELELILKSLNEKKRWLRVNTLKASIEEALECLEKTGLKIKPHSKFNDLILVNDPFIKIGQNNCVKKGLVIPQDISSYIATMMVKLNEEDTIDACSAPGVKLLQIYSCCKPRRIIAVDLSEKRLKALIKLVKSYIGNTYNIIVMNANSAEAEYNSRNASIIIDAPCSNSGAIYSDPAIKLNISRETVRRLSLIQRNILEKNLMKRGTIYFMTCSIHPSEGEEVIDYVLGKYGNKIELRGGVSFPGVAKGYPGFKSSSVVYRIQPHIVNGQGFFIAILEVK
ncbi:MAG: RsmB/NOP family class I SAM-dependent RNA methyltransferase [Desulfurococcaceae archaeon]